MSLEMIEKGEGRSHVMKIDILAFSSLRDSPTGSTLMWVALKKAKKIIWTFYEKKIDKRLCRILPLKMQQST